MILRLAHPIMPFITEEIWQRIGPLAGTQGNTIMLQRYPIVDETKLNPAAISEINWLMAVILGVRRIRGEMNIAPGKPLPVLLQKGSTEDRQFAMRNTLYLEKIARLETIGGSGT